MIDYLIAHKSWEWLFSGIGVVVVSGLMGLFFRKKQPPPTTTLNQTVNGSHNHTAQAGGDITESE